MSNLNTAAPPTLTEAQLAAMTPGILRVIRRNGTVTPFDASKIAVALTKAFLAVEGSQATGSPRIHNLVKEMSVRVTEAFYQRWPSGAAIHIEAIQDRVELELMRAEEHKVARAYVLYREERRKMREEQNQLAQEVETPTAAQPALQITLPDGQKAPLNETWLKQIVQDACVGLKDVNPAVIFNDTRRSLFDGVTIGDIEKALIMSARIWIEKEPEYSFVAARLLLNQLRREAFGFLNLAVTETPTTDYVSYFHTYLTRGVELELLDPQLLTFDLTQISHALEAERDLQFTYLGLQTLYDRYFIHSNGVRFELPQAFFMRVAMGLAIGEKQDREKHAIAFYRLLSSFDFMSSTPTLFNAGTLRPQLSSCFLTTIPDDLDGIYSALKDNALLSKYAGGLGNDWTAVRAMGAHIKGTNGKSQGVVPFMNVVDATAIAVNQCFAPETLVYTANGIQSIADIKIGDLVLGANGTYRSVTRTYTYNQLDPMVSLDIKHAIDPIRVTAGHPFYAICGVPMEQAIERTHNWLEKGKIKCEWVEAGQLKAGDYIAQTIPQEVIPVADFTSEDARLYGILLGDGHLSKDEREWGVSGNPLKDDHLEFIRTYLNTRGIHWWETHRGSNYLQIRWAAGRGVVRDATTGRIVGSGLDTLPFSYEDIYDTQHKKRIAPRFAHLPRPQTLALIQGLLETDGNISRNKEITFCNTSRHLVEGLRYQLLRLAIPTAGNKRFRRYNHTGKRSDGSTIQFNSANVSYDLRIPATPELATLMHCKALTKQNWFIYGNHLFTRLKEITTIDPIPFVCDLKVEGDESYMTTAGLAHNGGKRKGAVCGYLETWHMDVEEFLELRKNTGDERRRTHDMNTANWVPDLFMKRVFENKDWTLFSPDEVPDLHDLVGIAFETAYVAYEEKASAGAIRSKKLPALVLWRKMLSMLFETGHPWMTFKDPCNLRSPQQHVGVVHSSNLCTEITLNTSKTEIAVCNLGSINLVQHLQKDGKGLDIEKLKHTVRMAMRMLDNVIDINFYTVPQARNSNLRHRPVGLGLMGFHDALYAQGINYASDEAVAFADHSMEVISYYTIQASSDLAKERGKYESYEGSLWSQGILPIDSIRLLQTARGKYLEQDTNQTLDWESLRRQVTTVGMRNSNTMAIAPTATISNICGVSQSIEPTYQNLYVKSNLSGEFTVVNPYLVRDLKALNLWDDVMVNDLKYYDGSLKQIHRVPETLQQRYATAFEIEAHWLIEAASRRQKWIDQAQSLNLYLAEASGKKLDTLYRMAWLRGLKTTYYLRTMGATHTEKSTLSKGVLNAVKVEETVTTTAVCSIDNPDCEACQ